MDKMIRPTQNVSYGPQGWKAVFRPVLILFVCLGFFIIMSTFLLRGFGIHSELRGRTLVGLAGTLVSELVLFGLLMRWLKGQGRSLKDIGWGRKTNSTALLLGVLFALGYALYTLSNPIIGGYPTEI